MNEYFKKMELNEVKKRMNDIKENEPNAILTLRINPEYSKLVILSQQRNE